LPQSEHAFRVLMLASTRWPTSEWVWAPWASARRQHKAACTPHGRSECKCDEACGMGALAMAAAQPNVVAQNAPLERGTAPRTLYTSAMCMPVANVSSCWLWDMSSAQLGRQEKGTPGCWANAGVTLSMHAARAASGMCQSLVRRCGAPRQATARTKAAGVLRAPAGRLHRWGSLARMQSKLASTRTSIHAVSTPPLSPAVATYCCHQTTRPPDHRALPP
jgi:hypothetical protein